MHKTKIAMVLGIRPDIIRSSIVLNLLNESAQIDLTFIWSGQHYSDNMKDVFFRELEVKAPDIELNAKGDNDAELVGDIIAKLYPVLEKLEPAVVIYLGDTNTVASCLAAAQLNIPIFHIEGCMRSYDWIMPEEKYRTMIDHLSDVIYAYLPEYRNNGISEGLCPDRIVLTGNPIVDVLQKYYLIKKDNNIKNKILNMYNMNNNNYLVMTCHRRENIDKKKPLQNIINLAGKTNLKVLFFAGYRTQRKLKEFKITLPDNIYMYDPVGYRDLLYLMDSSMYVITDSGTIVEEACILGVPSIQTRYSTERPQVYDVGASVKFDPRQKEYSENELQECIDMTLKIKRDSWENPFGDGRASERIVNDIIRRLENKKRSLSTHDENCGRDVSEIDSRKWL